MEGLECNRLCMGCDTYQYYKVNQSELHGLCYLCASQLDSNQYHCKHCSLVMRISHLEQVPNPKFCNSCRRNCRTKCNSKKHYFCSDCQASIKNCPLCNCSICLNPSNQLGGCQSHPICPECTQKYPDKCFICSCQICNRPVDGRFQHCNHPACNDLHFQTYLHHVC